MVYVTGDTHGDFSRFSSRAARQMRKDDTLIILGDFGFLWDGGKEEQRLIKKLGKLKYSVLFLDGPHENYDLLKQYPVTQWNGGRVQVIDGNLMHLMRGEIYTIEYETYFVFGGGEDSNIDLRKGWEEAMPSAEEMLAGRRCLEEHGNKVDYILTHEPSGKARGYMGMKLENYNRLNGINAYFNRIEDSAEYKRWFFGSLHLDKSLSKRHLSVFQNIVPVHEKTAGKK